jgi:hypothetical protein
MPRRGPVRCGTARRQEMRRSGQCHVTLTGVDDHDRRRTGLPSGGTRSISRSQPLVDVRLVTFPVATRTTWREGVGRRHKVCLERVEAADYEVCQNRAMGLR